MPDSVVQSAQLEPGPPIMNRGYRARSGMRIEVARQQKKMRTAAALADRSGVAVLHARQRSGYECITRAHFEVQRLQFR